MLRSPGGRAAPGTPDTARLPTTKVTARTADGGRTRPCVCPPMTPRCPHLFCNSRYLSGPLGLVVQNMERREWLASPAERPVGCAPTRVHLSCGPRADLSEPAVLIPSQPPLPEGVRLAPEVRYCPMVMSLPQKVRHERVKMTRRGQCPPPDRRLSFDSLVGRKPETPGPDVGLTWA